MVFLSEPQLYNCDMTLLASPFRGKYSFLLNSEETSNPELALDCPKARGGTMIMWRTELDPYVIPLPTTSPSFLPVLLKIPPPYILHSTSQPLAEIQNLYQHSPFWMSLLMRLLPVMIAPSTSEVMPIVILEIFPGPLSWNISPPSTNLFQ